MSTPIVMRTKDQQSPYSSSATSGFGVKPSQFTRPYPPTANPQQLAIQQQQQQQAQVQVQQKSECEIYFSGKHDALYIYLSRLMAPIWDLKILNDLQSSSKSSETSDSLLFVTFADINLQWFLNKLNELRRFIDVNFPHLKTLHHSYLTSSLFQNAAAVAASQAAAQSGQSAQSSAAVVASSRFATQFGSMPLNMPALVGLTGPGTGILILI